MTTTTRRTRMSSIPRLSDKQPYWLEAALRGVVGPPPSPSPAWKQWFSTVRRQTFGSTLKETQPSSTALAAFSGVHGKSVFMGGLDAAGKTTLLHRQFSLDASASGSASGSASDVTTSISFIGVNIESVSYCTSDASVVFRSIDIGGCAPPSVQEFERALPARHDAIIWVVDACDGDRLVETVEELQRCANVKGKGKREVDDDDDVEYEGAVQGSPIVILANKLDRGEAMGVEAISKAFSSVTAMIGNRACKIFGVDAISGRGVAEALGWIANQLKEGGGGEPQSTEMGEKSATTYYSKY
ncbi:hypothetical protein K504DRAFT_455340 [Pleomassaria siparia CBS 279.74]|uniref:P-loop containing nucleoside triphosphate hydrolase protein n=1 Tax=Pleomassaria siparia CBS 279.74 TaxID=1314801 RepID=A0A6G1KB33_9PLEO|nr:hypothetical protein K504DRAFT_455340 [Pleomassaria siparia CBS 279.74]